MATYRVHKTRDYTVMSNHHLKNRDMSLKAKGLMSVMLSLPDDWDYSIEGLCAICKESNSAVKSALDEMKELGYLVVTKKMPNETESGRIEYIYDIYESPKQAEQAAEKQDLENQCLEIQGVENQVQLNTNKLNTNKLNTKYKRNIKENFESEFDELWNLYPNKKGKEKAFKCYIRERSKGTKFDDIKNGILNYCRHIKNNNISPQYIKQGSTWFVNRCWQDEYENNESFTDEMLKGCYNI